jgi:hypothetical protein
MIELRPAGEPALAGKHTSLAVCNKQADAKKLTGPERAKFVKDCRGGKSGRAVATAAR